MQIRKISRHRSRSSDYAKLVLATDTLTSASVAQSQIKSSSDYCNEVEYQTRKTVYDHISKHQEES